MSFILNRTSIREFKDTMIEPEKITELLNELNLTEKKLEERRASIETKLENLFRKIHLEKNG